MNNNLFCFEHVKALAEALKPFAMNAFKHIKQLGALKVRGGANKFILAANAFIFSSISVLAIDNGDGTYSNPMIHADHPDCEIIRVGDDYYYMTSSFHLVPANPVMHSKDLVNS